MIESERKIRNLTQNTVLFMISSFSSKIAAFLLVPLYTRVFSTDEYGAVDLAAASVQLLIPVLTLNIQEAVLRYGLDKKQDPLTVIRNAFRVIGWSSLFIGIVTAFFLFLPLPGAGGNYLIFLFFSYTGGAIYNVLSMYLKATDSIRLLAICGFVNAFVTCLLQILLLVVFPLGINGYMLAMVAGICIADLGMILFGHLPAKLYRAGTASGRRLLRPMLAYSIPLTAGSIGWWLNTASDRFILFLFCGAAVSGLYAAAYKVPACLAVLQDIFYNAWSVSAIENFDKNDSDGFIGSVYTSYSTLSVLACSFIMTINVFLIRLLYSTDFWEAWRYVPLLLVGTAFSGLVRFNGCFFLAVKRTGNAALSNILGAVINILFSFMLVPVLGAYGAAVSTLIGYFSLWVIRIWQIRSFITMRVNWKREALCYASLLAQAVTATVSENFVLQIPFFIFLVCLSHRFIRKSVNRFFRLKRGTHT